VRTKDTGKVTFLNSAAAYAGHFYVAVFPDDYPDFPAPPAEYFDGACVVVQGKVKMYKGSPEVVLKSADDIVRVGR
ncbi:MAG: nuclease, partial [Anaerolineae bacterium]